ncbi:hypothetical protein [Sphaerimonospora thailandensis]|uniref:Uncharacterized protein n=1 Tax=Sphaerimonospora thailandensis TaxID=795644 RepID=A0A8J3VZB2_9ACTN|nr:hypothetical protein [Sphaerimonospora thailandensis]GIH70322.1 hypothetical protein Mth01_25750 [Sphaerimonospora thailandensis]
MNELITWLRATIEGAKTTAEALGGKAWHVEKDVGDGEWFFLRAAGGGDDVAREPSGRARRAGPRLGLPPP